MLRTVYGCIHRKKTSKNDEKSDVYMDIILFDRIAIVCPAYFKRPFRTFWTGNTDTLYAEPSAICSFAALNLFVSTNGGESFIGPLVQVQGEIGKVAGQRGEVGCLASDGWK